MAIYTVGRRRVIVALLLSAALLLTLDLRGNPVIDTIRNGFSRAMSPVETATDVVTNPVQRAWNSYSGYDDLERENEILREMIDRQYGSEAAAEAAIIDYLSILALSELPSLAGIESVTSQVVGGATNNLDQIVEINKGSDQGIGIGMPVVNQAGLIGKITQVNATTSRVMLITDPRYTVAVEILVGTGEADTAAPAVTDTTAPSGLTQEEIDAVQAESVAATSTTTATTVAPATSPPEPGSDGSTPADVFGAQPSLPQAGDPNDPNNTTTTIADAGTPPGSDVPPDSTTTTTTTTTIPIVAEPEQLEKEFGGLEGRGEGLPPQVRFIQDAPSLAVLEEGDLVETAGGSKSLAPPNIPVGRVINVASRDGVAGPLLEIELHADLDKLNFVRVVLYRPLSQVSEP